MVSPTPQGKGVAHAGKSGSAWWCGLPPLQAILLVFFGLALFSICAFTVTLDRGGVHMQEPRKTVGGINSQHNMLRRDSSKTNGSDGAEDIDSAGFAADSGSQAKSTQTPTQVPAARPPINTLAVAKRRDTTEGGEGEGEKESPLADVHALPLEGAASLASKRKRELKHFHAHKEGGAIDIHFIHIPKCGGTSMTAILRQVACDLDPGRNTDCCTNVGFCDFHAMRRCASIRGCINHIPQRPWIFKPPPTLMLLREPTSRLLSAWFYRCHSPNADCYQVRPEFKLIKNGQLPQVTFDQYLDMPEYNNIQTRMLGADSFPYRNVTITREIFNAAVDAVDNAYFVGLQEAYEISVKLMMRELNLHSNSTKGDPPILKERDNTVSKSIKANKAAILGNKALMKRIGDINNWDRHLYRVATERFCQTVKKYPDLLQQLKATKVRC